MTLGVAPTSIHRYESGASTPDFPIIRKLLEYALAKENTDAQHFFMSLLAERMGLSKADLETPYHPRSFSTLQQVRFQGQTISSLEHLRIASLLLYLRSAKDDTTSRVLDALLAPWIAQAKDLLSEREISDTPEEPNASKEKSSRRPKIS